MADTSYEPGIYREQGGNRMVVKSGASLDVESGGEIDIESGGSLKLAGTALAATAAEINSAADVSAQTDTMAAGTVMAATLGSYTSAVVRHGPIIETTIYIDLTGAKSVATDLDVIGDTGACDIGQITTAINGVIFAGEVHCVEVPTTGADDIDLYASSVNTGAYDADASGLTDAQALMTAGGAHAIGTVKPFTVLPTADYYLYLASGEAAAGTYDAGILVIKMWGLAA